jgi:type VI secretion system protein ImpK
MTAARAKQARGRLLWAADTVLTLASQLRASRVVGDLASLREQLKLALREFKARARADGSTAERAAQATTILAALLDQVVTSMPWGADTGWQALGSPAATSAGRRPAQQLLDVARTADADAGMLELIAVALAMGFDGRAPSTDVAQLEALRSQVTRPLPNSSASAAGLSPQWRRAVARGPVLADWLPLWVSGLAAAALLAVLFFGLRISLGAKSDHLYARIAALKVAESTAPRLAAPTPRLGGLLEAQVAAHELTVRDEIDRSIIVIREAQLFTPGNATLAPAAGAVLQPVAAALQREPGHVEVLGHTDGTLVPSARYPSEWELSVARAHAVHDALRALGVASSRLGYNGRANIEPAHDGGGDGRAEIVLWAGR